MKIRIATRRSPLALWQARWVAAKIRQHQPQVEIEEVPIVTLGDRIRDRPLAEVGGKGLFVSEVEAAVSDGRADIAVHSLKDIPGDQDLAAGLALVCIPEREDPRDVLVSPGGAELGDLRTGAKVGTSSARRCCQLHARRPDLEYATLRGNVETRLRRLEEGRYQAIVLAAAGLRRLGLANRPHHLLPPEVCLPAVGQGTIAIEAAEQADWLKELLAPLEHPRSRIEAEAERALLRRLQGNCYVPIAGHARLNKATASDGGQLALDAMVGSLEGARMLSAASTRLWSEENPGAQLAAAKSLGEEVADELIAQGSHALIEQAAVAYARRQFTSN